MLMTRRLGLARFYDHGADPQSTPMVSTMDLALELMHSCDVTGLSDVTSVGAIPPGGWPMEEEVFGQVDLLVLADWVPEHWRNDTISRAVDVKLGMYRV